MLTPTYGPDYLSFTIFVPAPERGQGIGSAELWDFVQEADEIGMAIHIWCEPDPEMCEAATLARWYEGFGFERTGEIMDGAIYMVRPGGREG